MFAKTPDDALASLVGEIDKVAANNSDAKLSGVVNFTGEASDEYVEKIEKLADKLDLKHVAFTITSDGKRFKISEDAEVTVMHYKGKKVAYNYATKDKLNDAAIKEIVKATSTILE